MSRHLILVQVAEPEPGQARLQHHGLVVDDKPSIRTGLLCPTALPEFPGIQGLAALQAIADAAMPGEVSGVKRRDRGREVLGRADHGEPQVRSDPDSLHVLTYLVVPPNAGVEALGDDVDRLVVHAHLDLDLQVSRQKVGQHRSHDRRRGMAERRDPQGSRRRVGQRRQSSQACADIVEGGPQHGQQPLPGVRARHAARRAHQQLQAQALLQRPDQVAQGGGRQGQPPGRAREAPGFGQNGKGSQIVQPTGLHCCIPCMGLVGNAA